MPYSAVNDHGENSACCAKIDERTKSRRVLKINRFIAFRIDSFVSQNVEERFLFGELLIFEAYFGLILETKSQNPVILGWMTQRGDEHLIILGCLVKRGDEQTSELVRTTERRDGQSVVLVRTVKREDEEPAYKYEWTNEGMNNRVYWYEWANERMDSRSYTYDAIFNQENFQTLEST